MTSSSPPRERPLELAIFHRSSGATSVVPLPRGGALTFGRDESSDVRVNDPSVSRRHAVLHIGPPLEIEDLGSANGTNLQTGEGHEPAAGSLETARTRRISAERAPLCPGDAIILGGTLILVRERAANAPAPRPSPDGAVIVARAMREVYADADRAAATALPVLILGETGVGKDVLANAIHRASPRANKPFLALNCAALADSLLEAELFGYEKGAFTGALQARPGLFESAEGGTVFIDEVGDLPMPIQVKLLRVIELREVMRVGARTAQRIDVRFVSATHKDLEAEVARGAFRQDLLFRLNGLTLTIPPLRERPEEIGPLAIRFIETASRSAGRTPAPRLSDAALAALLRHSFPGNVRELRHAIDRAVALSDGDEILVEHLPPKLREASARPPAPITPLVAQAPIGAERQTIEHSVAAAERQSIERALAAAGGNRREAAALLGIGLRTLYEKLKRHGIK